MRDDNSFQYENFSQIGNEVLPKETKNSQN